MEDYSTLTLAFHLHVYPHTCSHACTCHHTCMQRCTAHKHVKIKMGEKANVAVSPQRLEVETDGSQELSDNTAQLKWGIVGSQWTMPPEYDVESKRGRCSTSSDFHIKVQVSLFMCMCHIHMATY